MRDITVIVGQSGSGKSHFAQGIQAQYKRRIVYDPLMEYDGIYFQQLDQLIDYCRENPASFAVRTDEYESFDLLCEVAYTLGDCCLTVEEIQRVIMPGQRPSMEFLDIVFRGRHNDVSLIAVAQRASSININIRSQFTRFISFRQSEPNDLQYMYDICGSWELVEKLPFLGIGQYLEIDNSGARFNDPVIQPTPPIAEGQFKPAPLTDQSSTEMPPENDFDFDENTS